MPALRNAPRRLLAFALSSAGLAGCFGSSSSETTGATTAALDGVAGLPAGAFRVQWDRDSAKIRVVHRSAPEKVLWETPAGGDFVHAASSVDKVDFARGCFQFDETVEASCSVGGTLDTVEADGDAVVARGRVSSCGLGYTLRFTAAAPDQLAFELTATPGQVNGKDVNRLFLTYASTQDEGFLGFGHQYDRVNMKGKRLPIWSGEQGHGRGQQPISTILSLPFVGGGCAGTWFTTYTAVPFYTTTKANALLLDNSEYSVFDMTADDRVTVETWWAKSMRGRIFSAATPGEAVTKLTAETGRMAPLPAWTQGGVMIRSRGGSDAARKSLAEAEAAGAKVAAMWIEDWAGERTTPFGYRMWWNWQVDRDLYADWEKLIADISARGVRVLVYFNPFLADVSSRPHVKRNLYLEAKAQGLLVKTQAGDVYKVGNGGFDAGVLDLTNPAAQVFIKGLMKEQLALGVSGWMADFGEAIALDAKLFSGADPHEYHNVFPYEWARMNREAVREAGREGDALFFNRSGNVKSPSQTMAFWVGDQTTTWDEKDGLKTVIPALLSGGLSGYAIDHADVGGWLSLHFPFITYERTKELEIRWMELGALTPIFRLIQTNQPEKNWQHDSDAETLRIFSDLSRLFVALAPDRARAMEESASLGWPVVRHPIFHYPSDPNVRDLKEEFMIGSDLLAAPVVDQGATNVTAYLPAGTWVHVWTGKVYGDPSFGGPATVDAPWGRPALFYRSGSASGPALVERLRASGLL